MLLLQVPVIAYCLLACGGVGGSEYLDYVYNVLVCDMYRIVTESLLRGCSIDQLWWLTGLTKNDGHENDGPSKLLDMNLQYMKLTDQVAGHEITGHEIAGHEFAIKTQGMKMA